MNRTLFLAAIATSAAFPAFAQPRLPAAFGSAMVLQCRADCPVWGWAAPREKITVSADFLGAPVTTTADDRGRWLLHIATPKADGPPFAGHKIEIRGQSAIVLDDVLIGEVWICSGQSNMEWPLSATPDWQEAVKAPTSAPIRLMDVANVMSATPLDDCHPVALGGEAGSWHACTEATASSFSAVAFYFAQNLTRRLGVPVGLVGVNWGGTPAEAWTSAEGLSAIPRFAEDVAWVKAHPGEEIDATAAQALGAWKAAVTDAMDRERTALGKPDASWTTIDVPSTLEGAFAAVDGAFWYQRTVDIPEGLNNVDATLSLGPIDDMDLTYFDGGLIGSTLDSGRWNAPRRYAIARHLLAPGPHTLMVCVIDTMGAAGINGKAEQLFIEPAATDHAKVLLSGPWQVKAGTPLSALPTQPQLRQLTPNTATSLYNGMIAPLLPMRIRGAIWYQGESNRGQAELYGKLMPALIADWRGRFGSRWNGQEQQFPFYFVQIAPYNYGGGDLTALLRQSQTRTAREVPNTGMAVTLDIGNPADIHPRNKKDVGDRLARLALRRTYGVAGVVDQGPTYASHRADGDRLIITFDHTDGGLNCEGDIEHFEVAGADMRFYPATARIDGNTIVVSSDKVPNPVHVRYAWSDAPMTRLHNGAGLPAEPFNSAAP